NRAMGRFEAATTEFTAALQEANEIGDLLVKGTLLTALGDTLFFAHSLDEMAKRETEALLVAAESGNEALRASILGVSGRRYEAMGRLTEATAALNECLRLGKALQHKPALVTGLAWRGFLHFLRSEYERRGNADERSRSRFGIA